MVEGAVADVLGRARAAGVGRFVVPGTTLADSGEAAGIAAAHPDVVAAVGVHPHEARDFDPERDGAALEELARRGEVAAIGEIGLDFHYDLSPRSTQMEVLEWMLDLARRLDLPAILHNRDSGSEMLALLERLGPRENAGVFHSFTESARFGRQVIDLGFRVSFSGMITFRSADNIREAAAGLPLDALLIETDSPYLAPEPHRGKRCEPAFVVETAKRLAEVQRVTVERVAEATTASFERLFPRRSAG
jgi:TatD DNase family protein